MCVVPDSLSHDVACDLEQDIIYSGPPTLLNKLQIYIYIKKKVKYTFPISSFQSQNECQEKKGRLKGGGVAGTLQWNMEQ